jgi:hypothetical protein
MFTSISHSQHINLYVFQDSGSQQEAGTGYDFVDAITCVSPLVNTRDIIIIGSKLQIA